MTKSKLRLKIFPKTFIGSLSLIIGIIIVAFILISVLTPRFYRVYKEDMLNAELSSLILSFEQKNVEEITSLLIEFTRLYAEYGVNMQNENGDVIFARSLVISREHFISVDESNIESGFSVSMTGDVIGVDDYLQSERLFTASDGTYLILTLYASMQPIDEVSVVLFHVLPYVLLFCIILSAFVSFIYAKTITAPIKAISQATVGMRALDKNAKCSIESSDEIGELAGNINQLYGRLLSTINDLQSEMQNVTAADKEKIDFMLTVSHELKTPLTSVKGMLEGMIYNVGIYKDRDEYLTRCLENIDALTALLNEILNASKLKLSPSPDDYSDISIFIFVKNVTTAYEMIALSKQVNIDIDIMKNISYELPSGMFAKALSNIISNAVKFTALGGTVKIYTDNHKLIIENTCSPLSPEETHRAFEPFYKISENGGHGLGLYLTERILKVCGLPFEFVPYDEGMRFIIYMK